jgi:hypothetical protein
MHRARVALMITGVVGRTPDGVDEVVTLTAREGDDVRVMTAVVTRCHVRG